MQFPNNKTDRRTLSGDDCDYVDMLLLHPIPTLPRIQTLPLSQNTVHKALSRQMSCLAAVPIGLLCTQRGLQCARNISSFQIVVGEVVRVSRVSRATLCAALAP